MALQKLPPDPRLEPDPGDLRHKVVLEGPATVQMLTEVGTHAWKARQRLARALSSESPGDMNRIQRHVEGILESLTTLGLEIKDHTGETFDYGQSLRVVATQPRENITQEVVAETIRPTIYLQGHRIQQGEVVIDTPIGTKE
jgi:hypothetical protein